MEAITATVIVCYAVFILFVLLVAALLLFVATLFRVRQKYGHLPSPRGESLFLGHLSFLSHAEKKTGMRMINFLHMWMSDLGPVFYVRFAWQPWVLCADADMIKEVCLDSRHPKPRWMYQYFFSIYGERFMGWGLVSETNHEKWRVKRALVNPAFKRSYLMFMMEKFNETAEGLCSDLVGKADGKTLVPMLDAFNDVALKVIMQIGFNMDPDRFKTIDSRFDSAVSLTLEGMNRAFTKPFITMDPRSKARTYRQTVRDACKLVRGIGKECIEERLAAKRRGDDLPTDILACILNNQDDLDSGQLMGIVDEFATFFMAGQETTSNLLAFTLLHLGRHQDVAKRLVKEVDEVLGQKPVIEYADLGKLEYMSRVLKETLRLTPPVGGISRQLAFDVNCCGYKIPKGASVSFLSYLTARRDEYFDDALLFNPDRFAANEPKHLFAYFPFAVGQRNCIGQHLALIEAKVIIGKLLQRFSFRLDQAQRNLIVDEVTNKPLDRCQNYISLRET